MAILIVDLAVDPTPRLSALKASGVKSIFGYLSSIAPNGDKCWNLERVKAAAAAGMRVGLVHEGWGGVNGRGISALDGARDGKYCRARAVQLGAPRGACVYFACDQDFTASEIRAKVLPYFEEIRGAFSDKFYRVGVYGSGAVCAAVKASGFADLTWEAQSRGWMSYAAWLAKADLKQGPDIHFDGLDLDSDVAAGDIGDFVPTFPVDMSPPKPVPAPVVEVAPAAVPVQPAAVQSVSYQRPTEDFWSRLRNWFAD